MYSVYFSASDDVYIHTPNLWHNHRAVTAVLLAYTQEGFVIGADGLCRNSDGTERCRESKKVFSFEANGIRMAYAWAGAVESFDKDQNRVFDYRAVSQDLFWFACRDGRTGFLEFIQAFCEGLPAVLYASPLLNRGDISKPLSDEEIPRVLLGGYFDGVPCIARIKVSQEGTSLLHPSVEILNAPLYGPVVTGFTPTETMPKEFAAPNIKSLDDAASYVKKYLQFCADDTESNYADIGGKIHIGSVTPEKFSWVDAPAPESGD